MVYTNADPKSACPRAESPSLSSHIFLDFPPAERVLSEKSSKSSEFYPIKNVFKKKRKRIAVIVNKIKNRMTLPTNTADPKKSKSRF
jgi:hypothetical protein